MWIEVSHFHLLTIFYAFKKWWGRQPVVPSVHQAPRFIERDVSVNPRLELTI